MYLRTQIILKEHYTVHRSGMRSKHAASFLAAPEITTSVSKGRVGRRTVEPSEEEHRQGSVQGRHACITQ